MTESTDSFVSERGNVLYHITRSPEAGRAGSLDVILPQSQFSLLWLQDGMWQASHVDKAIPDREEHCFSFWVKSFPWAPDRLTSHWPTPLPANCAPCTRVTYILLRRAATRSWGAATCYFLGLRSELLSLLKHMAVQKMVESQTKQNKKTWVLIGRRKGRWFLGG